LKKILLRPRSKVLGEEKNVLTGAFGVQRAEIFLLRLTEFLLQERIIILRWGKILLQRLIVLLRWGIFLLRRLQLVLFYTGRAQGGLRPGEEPLLYGDQHLDGDRLPLRQVELPPPICIHLLISRLITVIFVVL